MASRSNSFKSSFLYKALMGNTPQAAEKYRRRSEPPRSRSSSSMSSNWEIINKEDIARGMPSHRNSESSIGSWQEYSCDEDYDQDVAQQVHLVRKSLEESLSFGPLSKQLLLNQINGLERLASVLSQAEKNTRSKLSPDKQEKLDRYRESLCVNLDINDNFYDQLIAKRVVSEELADEIRSVGTKRRQVATLIDLIKLLGEKAYAGFCSALVDSSQGYLVDTLHSDMDEERQRSMSESCPSFDRHLSERTEHIVLPVSCFPKSNNSIMMDISVREGGAPLLDPHGKPQSRMCPVYTMALTKNRVRLCRELFGEIIFDYFLEDEILTNDVTEALFLLGTRHRMNQVLLNILPFYGDAAFISLVSALKKTGQDHLALLLDDYVLENRKRFEKSDFSSPPS